MASKAKAFPFPVLRSWVDDYLNSEFSLEMEFAIQDGKIVADYEIRLNHPEITERIVDRRALVGLMLESRETLTKVWLPLESLKSSLFLDKFSLHGEVSITAYVVSLEDSDSFSPSDVNQEFGATSFQLLAGDPLAISEELVQHISFDRRSDPELITIQLNVDLAPDAYSFDFTGNTVVISAGSKIMQYYNLVSEDKSQKPHLFQGIYKDAITAALLEISKNSEANEYAWSKGLLSQAEAVGHDRQDDIAFEQANEIALLLVAKDGIRKVIQDDANNAA